LVLEALVSAFLVVVAAAVADSQVVEIAADGIARAAAEVAEVAADDAEAADIAGDMVEVVAVGTEVVDNCIEAVAAEIAVASVQNLVVCKTHPGSATVATAVD